MLARWRSFFRTATRRQQFEADLDDELRFHLDSRAADLARAGLPPDEARRRARIELGAVEAHKEDVRRARGLDWLDDLLADQRFALRSWRRHRGLALAVIAILTVGIGIASTIFTVLNAAVLRPQVHTDPASFAKLYVARAIAPAPPGGFDPPEIEDLLALEGATRTLAAVAGARRVRAPLDDDPEVRGALVTCQYFAVHAGRPLHGRLLAPRDCTEGAAVMVIDEGLWRRLGADPALVGQTLKYQRRAFTLVGVLAGRVDGGFEHAAVFIPHSHADLWPSGIRWERRYETAARLRPGHRHADATAELELLLQQQDAQHPGRRSHVVVTDGAYLSRPSSNHEDTAMLGLLVGLLAMIVLLVCSNVVTLLLARAHTRRHEIAVRLSLGAGRGRLLRMLAVETLPLAVAAGGLSLLLAHRLPTLLVHHLDKHPRDVPLHPDARVWIFVAAISVLAALASGVSPALEALKVDLLGSLKGRPGDGGARGSRLQQALIVAQIAATVILLVGAGLFVRGYLTASPEELGFDTDHTLVAPLHPRGDHPSSWAAVHQAVRAELRAAPGIAALALAEARPPGGQYVRVRIDDGPGTQQLTQLNGVSPEFFATLGLPILRGRAFSPGDSATAPVVPVIVSRRLARALWKDADPLGSRLRGDEDHRFEVVGVAGDILRPGKTDPPAVYRPLLPMSGVLLARFSGDPAAAVATVESSVRRAAPGVFAVARTVRAGYEDSAWTLARFASVVLVVGGCAMLIALVSVYGTVAFNLRRRTREMGIRVALGARGRDVVRALVVPTAKAVAAGLALGMTVAYLVAPALQSKTGELAFHDPVIYGAAVLLLGAVAVIAMVRPVLRALTLDQLGPATVLRDE